MTSISPHGRLDTRTGRQLLERVLIPTDHLGVDDDGHLLIEKCRATDLLQEHGSPVFVMSESTLRANVTRVVDAFTTRWPAEVNVMFAIKANNNIAVRTIMSELGLGNDCFSSGEIHATLAGGANASRVALNGSNKAAEALTQAIEHGMVVNLDSHDELDLVEAAARSLGQPARVTVRLRLPGEDYDRARAADPHLPDLRHFIDTEQVGSSHEMAGGSDPKSTRVRRHRRPWLPLPSRSTVQVAGVSPLVERRCRGERAAPLGRSRLRAPDPQRRRWIRPGA